MPRTADQLRRDALAIWQAGVAAVRADHLVQSQVQVAAGRWLVIGPWRLDLAAIGRIVVVGAGKAGAGMAEGLETALGPQLLREKQVTGWINVPENCVRPLRCIHLHAARPAGVNEPTADGVTGAREILRLVEQLGENDLCLALISGGGSALLPLPVDGITLDDKLAVTRFLSAAGAPIDELNTVRKQLSQIKGGGLARCCRSGRLVSLVISDILGDPLDLIASGPTVPNPGSPAAALEILARYDARGHGISARVFQALERQCSAPPAAAPVCQVDNLVIGNNNVAVEAAAREARSRGYHTTAQSAPASEGPAEQVGRQLADWALQAARTPGAHCLVSGGEPTVKLAPAERRGLGGRNQQLVLAAAEQWIGHDCRGLVMLSGGTDGEDGPTDAAGAWLDGTVLEEARRRGLGIRDHLERNDAYHWFQPLAALIRTGPTDTNVCDVRVVLADR